MTRLIPLALLLCASMVGCSDPPAEVTTEIGDSASSGTGPATAPTMGGPTDGGPADTEVATGDGDTGTSSADTTVGVTATDTGTVDPSTDGGSSSDGPPPDCVAPDDCASNQTCNAGQCEAACPAWGPSNYGGCLDAYGGFDTDNACGADNLCVYYGVPMQATACSLQGCASACDCPGPAATGDATVSCGDITNDGAADCYLSCADGETCPDGTVCLTGGANSFCMTPPSELPTYGNCGNVAAECVDGTECVEEDGYSMCVDSCFEVGGCDPAPPGASDVACGSVIYPPFGAECHLSCSNDTDCPAGMECFTTGVDGQLCMWPPL